jgi:hypothetical protein
MQSSAWLLRYKCDFCCFVCIIRSKFAVRRVVSLLHIRKYRVQISARKVSALADTCCGFLQCFQENAEIESQNRSRHITGYVVCYSDGSRVKAIQLVASNFTRPLPNSWNYNKHIRKTPWSESASELYRPSDRRLSTKWLPTLANIGCHVVSVTDPYGCILDFLDRSRYFSIK